MNGYDPYLPPQDNGLAGFYLATVLSNSDNENKGTLKVRLLNEGIAKNILEGVKLVAPFAGKAYGVYALPEVGDQVLIGFLGGCYDRPFALGSIYSESDQMMMDCNNKSNYIKRVKTKGGSLLEVFDDPEAEKITVKTPQKLSMVLDQKPETATLTATEASIILNGKSGSVTVKANKEIRIQTGSAKLTMKSDGTILLEGAKVELKGASVKVNGSGSVAIHGQKSDLSGALVEVKAQGVLMLKGSVTKIN